MALQEDCDENFDEYARTWCLDDVTIRQAYEAGYMAGYTHCAKINVEGEDNV